MRRVSPETTVLIQRLFEPPKLRKKIMGPSSGPFAPEAEYWPDELLDQIHGETVMGRTVFAATMKDGKNFTFATNYTYDFFDLPEGYSYKDIIEIHSGMVALEDGKLNDFSLDWSGKYYRNKPSFYCYTGCLPES